MAGRLILWDIDGTLIRAGQVARVAFDRAVERVLRRYPGEHGVMMGGKTDPQIAREILTFAEVCEDQVDSHLPQVIMHLEAELACAQGQLRVGGQVLPGVVDLLARLEAQPEVLQSVLTGNTAANAAVKLAAFGLERWLDLEVGAYGSDDFDRLRLVPLAVERSRRLRKFEPEVVWVIGDTERDLACARAGGACCLLVGTGRLSHLQLEALPGVTNLKCLAEGDLTRDGQCIDVLVDDLSDVDTLTRLLLS